MVVARVYSTHPAGTSRAALPESVSIPTARLTYWREDSWRHAVQRVETTGDAQREVLRQKIEASAMRWARLFDL